MKRKSALVFAAAVGLFLTAATYRFYDSAHAIGRLSAGGGEVNHPVLLDEGRPWYTIIVTGVVMPPYRGDARVALEGDPSWEVRIHNSEPVIDLGFFRRPQFMSNTLYGLRARDKVALWVVMQPKDETAADAAADPGAAAFDCCDIQPASSAGANPGGGAAGRGKTLAIAFRDTRTGKPLLRVPVLFRGKGVSSHDPE